MGVVNLKLARWQLKDFLNFHPAKLWKMSNLTHIFQMGWRNHQPENPSKIWMGPNPNGPRLVSCDPAIGIFRFKVGVRGPWVRPLGAFGRPNCLLSYELVPGQAPMQATQLMLSLVNFDGKSEKSTYDSHIYDVYTPWRIYMYGIYLPTCIYIYHNLFKAKW